MKERTAVALALLGQGCMLSDEWTQHFDADNDEFYTFDDASGEYDCNDNNSAIHPGATEVCDFVDNDCDGDSDTLNVPDGAHYDAVCDGEMEVITISDDPSWLIKDGGELVALAVAADATADGLPDALVGVPDAAAGDGAVWLVSGDPGGETMGGSGFALSGPAGSLGGSVSADDLDGDGRTDLVVGAPTSAGETGDAEGAVALWWGDAALAEGAEPDLVLEGLNGFGSSSVILTDGEGGAWLAVGSPDWNVEGSGAVVVTTMSTTGLLELPLGSTATASNLTGASLILSGTSQSAGADVLASADLNADGSSDLLVSAFGSDGFSDVSYVAVFLAALGGPAGAEDASFQTLNDADCLIGIQGQSSEGMTVASNLSWDWDGDGADDIAFGLPAAEAGAGTVYIRAGSIYTSESTTCSYTIEDSFDVRLRGPSDGAFGQSLTALQQDDGRDVLAVAGAEGQGNAWVFSPEGFSRADVSLDQVHGPGVRVLIADAAGVRGPAGLASWPGGARGLLIASSLPEGQTGLGLVWPALP